MKSFPNNADLERQMIGQCLVDAKCVSRELSTDDFYSPFWRACWAAIVELDEDGKEIEPFAVLEILKRDGGTAEMPVLVNASLGLIAQDNVADYVRQLKDLSARRKILRTFGKLQGDIEDGKPLNDIVLNLETLTDENRTKDVYSDERFVHIADVVRNDIAPALDELEAGRAPKLPIGIPIIDNILRGGVTLSDVVIIAGLTGSGKSALALRWAYEMAKQGTPVAYLSGEMTNRENGLRLLSMASGVPNLNAATDLKTYKDQNRQRLDEWAGYLAKLPLHFDHRTLDLRSLISHAKALVRRHGVKVLVVDYIQLLNIEKGNTRMSRHEKITEISQSLKRLANELNICVINLAQFNREGAKSSGETSMHDLEASGQLEKDASLIFILDRDPADERLATLRLVKGRNVARCKIPCAFAGFYLKFAFGQQEVDQLLREHSPRATNVREASAWT